MVWNVGESLEILRDSDGEFMEEIIVIDKSTKSELGSVKNTR
jgi:hypothetical protein